MVLRTQHLFALKQLAGQLRAGEAATGNGEGKQPTATFGVGLLRRLAEHVLHVGADAHGIFQGPAGEAVLLNPGNIKELRLTAGPDDQIIVWILGDLGDALVIVKIYGLYFVNLDVHSLTREYLRKADLHRLRLRARARYLVQFGHQGVIRVLIDNGDVHLVVLLEVLIEFFSGFNTTVTATKHNHACLFGHESPLSKEY